MKQPAHNSFLLLSHLSPEWNQSHAWPKGAFLKLGEEMSSLPHLHHAHGSPKAEQGQGQGSPNPSFLTGDHHPSSCHCLPPTLIFARVPTNSQLCGVSLGPCRG